MDPRNQHERTRDRITYAYGEREQAQPVGVEELVSKLNEPKKPGQEQSFAEAVALAAKASAEKRGPHAEDLMIRHIIRKQCTHDAMSAAVVAQHKRVIDRAMARKRMGIDK